MSNLVHLPPDHFIVPCRYAPPSEEELEKALPGGVSSYFDEGNAWQKYSLCINASEKPGNRIMLAKRFKGGIESEEAIAWGNDYRTEVAPNGYRPAMGHYELFDYYLSHRRACRRSLLVALGSFVLAPDYRRVVMVLLTRCAIPMVNGLPFDFGWEAYSRFLFVAK